LRRPPTALLLALALGTAPAPPAAGLDLQAGAAFGGWSRQGRVAEVVVRLAADAPTRVTLDLRSGPQTLRSRVDLQPGRPLRLDLPLRAAGRIDIVATPDDGAALSQSLPMSLSESPQLGLALAGADSVAAQGFHALALTPEQLPRQAAAYDSLDAFVVDAATLAALDAAQLGALLDFVALCGRVVVVGAADDVRRQLDAGAGCRGGTLVHADAAPQAAEALRRALSARVPPLLSDGAAQGLARPGLATWNAVSVALAAALAAVALCTLFLSSMGALLATSALAALALLGGLAWAQAAQPGSNLFVWSEGDSGASFARYQAWQWLTGVARQTVRVELPPQLTPSVRACQPGQPLRLDFDAAQGRIVAAAYDARLFSRLPLCYQGQFPQGRTLTLVTAAEGPPLVRNDGASAWPAGRLLVGRSVHALPALGPGQSAALAPGLAGDGPDPVLATAASRLAGEGWAGLWPLDLDGVGGAPPGAQGWLSLTVDTK
jgi:hypothetical protein